MNDLKYYDVMDDITAYPDAWCYIVYGPRGSGKTYSALRAKKDGKSPFIYIKRTKDDVDLITAGTAYGTDFSPYKPINRDFGTNIKAQRIRRGIGMFWNYNDKDEQEGPPIGYLFSLNGTKNIKGFELSECDWMVFDEFMPQKGERISRAEGDQLLDMYMTVARDREKRGKEPLKLILFANSTEISSPVTNTLEVVDTMADMVAAGRLLYYDEKRKILFHQLTEGQFKINSEENMAIADAMMNTQWGKMSFAGDFAYNDFSNINYKSIKKMQPLVHLHYKNYDYYIYLSEDGNYYCCNSKQKCQYEYDLNLENDQKRFWLEWGIDLREVCIDGRFTFQKYTMYDLIVNYKKFFEL